MREFLSQKRGRARLGKTLGTSLGASLRVSVGISLCAGALVCGPLSTSVWAAPAMPTIGGDENGPKVQIMQPAYQDVLKGKTKILIAVKSQKFNPQFVEMFIDDKPATTGPIAIAALPSAQYDWDTKLFPDGPHKLMVRVTDTQGFRGWAEVNVFLNNQKKIDSLPPSLKWQNTKSFQQLSGTTSIQLDALDNFGVKWLFITLAKASDPTVKLRSWMLNRPPYMVKLDTTQVPDGVYQLQAKAYDSFEQEGEAPALTLGVVNSAINATTVGDMLAGLQRVEAGNQKAAPLVKPGRQFTLETPENGSARAETSNSNPFGPATAPKATTPRVAARPSVVKPKTAAPSSSEAARLARSLAPSMPPVMAPSIATKPSLKTEKTTVAKLAAPTPEGAIAAPQLSQKSGVAAQRSLSGVSGEIDSAVKDDWRARLARVGAPDAGTRSESISAAAPAWSGKNASDASRRASLAPFKIERESNAAQPARLSAPPTLLARGDAADAKMPRISAPDTTPQTQISPRQALVARLEALKTGKAVTPRAAAPSNGTRLSALPRPLKNTALGAINAITVSPLQVNVSDALPAFHTAMRSTDLRAVAARYGLPLEVVAANNGWKTDHVLVAGDRVKLPTQLKVAYHGVPVDGDAPSMLVGGTGVTAFRFMFEKAGGKLTWDAKKQRVIARKGESEVTLSIGSNHAKVGDKDVMLELAAFLFEGRTMVPVRFFEEGLHAQVDWDPQTGRLVVAMAG